MVHRRDRSPSQRFRIEQCMEFLKEHGYEYDFSHLLSAKDDRIFYSKGNYHRKVFIIIKHVIKRLRDVWNAKKYDIIFIQREAFLLGTTIFERMIINRSGAKVIYDFDDAIWKHNISDANKSVGWLKNPEKTKTFLEIADIVIAGNQYLRDYAVQFNKNVYVIPTTIDTELYVPKKRPKDDKIIIGWSGSFSTIEHFEHALTSLKIIKEKYKHVEFKVIGDESYINEDLGIRGLPWRKENEIKEISSFDIGIMPLPDNEWTKGKCALKGLQYMALEIPVVMSEVGVNKEIIQNGENGFLVKNTEERVDTLSLLIESEKLRNKLGKKGRKTVIDKYSVKATKNLYLKLFKHVL